jgi:hypothetical protein
MTEPSHKPTFREINISAEIKRMYGPRWNEPELAYVFSNDRKFYLRTEDAAIYSGAAVGDFLLDEAGNIILDEASDNLLGETTT